MIFVLEKKILISHFLQASNFYKSSCLRICETVDYKPECNRNIEAKDSNKIVIFIRKNEKRKKNMNFQIVEISKLR